MAARITKGTEELHDSWRERIRASQIINRLVDCVNGKAKLDAQQVKSADILLRKIIPDIARTELTGKDGKDIAAFIYDARKRVARE